MGIFLTLVAFILLAVLAPISIIYTFFAYIFQKKFSEYCMQVAIALDAFGGVVCQGILDLFLITKDGIKFGDRRATVSAGLGENKAKGTLTNTGRFICWVLDSIQKNHVESAAKDN